MLKILKWSFRGAGRRPCIQAGCWEGLIQLGHSSTLHRPADWQFQFLKGAEEYQVVTEVIRATSVGCILWGSPTRRTQVAGKEMLWSRIPTVFQRNILGNLLNAVRIRRDNKDGVQHGQLRALRLGGDGAYLGGGWASLEGHAAADS